MFRLVFNQLYRFDNKFKAITWTSFMRIYLKLIGVKLGKGTVFQGRPFVMLSRKASMQIGINCRFVSNTTGSVLGQNHRCLITVHDEGKLNIGNNCGFSGTTIGAVESIMIGDHVRCGSNTLITDSDWHVSDKRSSGSKEVVLEDNVWLGEGVRVFKGSRIGKNSLIAAGSVVFGYIPPNSIAGGNPARVISKFEGE
jgi:acetyltransferase-like isoleucine patch superfamily enzyme